MILGADIWFVFFGWVFCSLVSVVLFEYYKSVVAVGSRIESASEDGWVAEKNDDGLGEKAAGTVGKRWGILSPTKRWDPQRAEMWWEGSSCKHTSVEQRIYLEGQGWKS